MPAFQGSPCRPLASYLALSRLLHGHEAHFITEEVKVLYALRRLEGRALIGFVPEAEDFLTERRDKKENTKLLCGSFTVFENRLELFFGN